MTTAMMVRMSLPTGWAMTKARRRQGSGGCPDRPAHVAAQHAAECLLPAVLGEDPEDDVDQARTRIEAVPMRTSAMSIRRNLRSS